MWGNEGRLQLLLQLCQKQRFLPQDPLRRRGVGRCFAADLEFRARFVLLVSAEPRQDQSVAFESGLGAAAASCTFSWLPSPEAVAEDCVCCEESGCWR